MSLDALKRLLQCGHWWSRRLSCTVAMCVFRLLFVW
jgi:hypothetical protein